MTFTAETWTTDNTFGDTYDTVGNLLTVQDSVSNAPDFTFTYDARNQVQLEQQSYFPGISSLNIDRDYDSTGNRTRTAVNIGGTITAGAAGTGGSILGGINDFVNSYGYDRLYRLTSVSQRTATTGIVNTVAAKFASFNYNVASQMTDSRRFSDVTSTPANLEVHSRYAYDGAARLTSITHAKTEIAAGQAWNGSSTLPASITPAGTIAAYAFTYDRDNRMSSLASYADRFTTSFVHDPTDQLTAATSVAIAGLAAPAPLPTAESYNLDANGNRNTPGGVSQSASGTYNRLQTDGTFNYAYDNEGNMTRKTRISNNTYTAYTWNHRNQLIDVSARTSTDGLVKRTIYEYDAFGRRVMDYLDRTGDAIYDQYDRWFHDGPDRLFQIRDSDGQGTAEGFRISNRYLHGDATDRVLADEQFASGLGPAYQSAAASTAPGTTLWSVADQLGSARDLVDNDGIVRKHVIYDSFGKRLSEVNRAAGTGVVLPALSTLAVDSVFGYTGADWDADVGLTNHDARWYDANTGRWLSQDPIQDDYNNLYRYVGNSPTNATDPTGLIDWQSIKLKLGTPDTFIVTLDNGTTIEVDKKDKDAYQCHSLSFGADVAPGGPYMVYGDDVPKILRGDNWVRIPASIAKPGDIVVWRKFVAPSQRATDKDHGAVVHSAVLVNVVLDKDGHLDEEKTFVDHKPGAINPVEKGATLLEVQRRFGGGYSVYRDLGSKETLRIDKRYPKGASEWPDRDIHDGLDEFIEKLFGKIPNDTPKCAFPVGDK